MGLHYDEMSGKKLLWVTYLHFTDLELRRRETKTTTFRGI